MARTIADLPADRETGKGRIGFYEDGNLKFTFTVPAKIGGNKKTGQPPRGLHSKVNDLESKVLELYIKNWKEHGELPEQKI